MVDTSFSFASRRTSLIISPAMDMITKWINKGLPSLIIQSVGSSMPSYIALITLGRRLLPITPSVVVLSPM